MPRQNQTTNLRDRVTVLVPGLNERENESLAINLILQWVDKKEKEKRLEKELEMLKKERKNLTEKIQNLGIVYKGEKVVFEGFKISWTAYHRKILNQKLLKEERPDIYNEYSSEIEVERFDIK